MNLIGSAAFLGMRRLSESEALRGGVRFPPLPASINQQEGGEQYGQMQR